MNIQTSKVRRRRGQPYQLSLAISAEGLRRRRPWVASWQAGSLERGFPPPPQTLASASARQHTSATPPSPTPRRSDTPLTPLLDYQAFSDSRARILQRARLFDRSPAPGAVGFRQRTALRCVARDSRRDAVVLATLTQRLHDHAGDIEYTSHTTLEPGVAGTRPRGRQSLACHARVDRE